MNTYVVKAAGLCPEPISIVAPNSGVIDPALCRTGIQLMHTVTATAQFESELGDQSLNRIMDEFVDWGFSASDGKQAAGIAIGEFLRRIQASRQATAGLEREILVMQTDESIIYIEISPTKHLKSSGLLVVGTNGSRRPWLFSNVAVPTTDQSTNYNYQLGASIYVLVEAGA